MSHERENQCIAVMSTELTPSPSPRCHRACFHTWWYHNPLARRCVHCRLPKWSEDEAVYQTQTASQFGGANHGSWRGHGRSPWTLGVHAKSDGHMGSVRRDWIHDRSSLA